MGWTKSPNIFTATTENVADIANAQLLVGATFGPHSMDAGYEAPVPVSQTPASVSDNTLESAPDSPKPPSLPQGDRPKHAAHYRTPLALWDVYVDDFLGLFQGGTRTRRRVKRALLQTLDTVLRPREEADSCHRQEPASTKKMARGDSAWSTVKVILGWVVDTMANNISLPVHLLTRIREILASIGPTQRRVSLKKRQQILGELRSMALAIPAAIGLF
jgi:hypothetical protein